MNNNCPQASIISRRLAPQREAQYRVYTPPCLAASSYLELVNSAATGATASSSRLLFTITDTTPIHPLYRFYRPSVPLATSDKERTKSSPLAPVYTFFSIHVSFPQTLFQPAIDRRSRTDTTQANPVAVFSTLAIPYG